MIDQILTNLSTETIDDAVKMAELPREIRGYGHVKEKAVQEVWMERNTQH